MATSRSSVVCLGRLVIKACLIRACALIGRCGPPGGRRHGERGRRQRHTLTSGPTGASLEQLAANGTYKITRVPSTAQTKGAAW